MFGSAGLRRISDTFVNDGEGGKRLVRPGDTVILLPPHLRTQDEEHGDYFAKKHFESLRYELGGGPFTISYIRRWPCGHTMLYLKGAKTDEPACDACEFM